MLAYETTVASTTVRKCDFSQLRNQFAVRSQSRAIKSCLNPLKVILVAILAYANHPVTLNSTHGQSQHRGAGFACL
jgi:hypothetical protein